MLLEQVVDARHHRRRRPSSSRWPRASKPRSTPSIAVLDAPDRAVVAAHQVLAQLQQPGLRQQRRDQAAEQRRRARACCRRRAGCTRPGARRTAPRRCTWPRRARLTGSVTQPSSASSDCGLERLVEAGVAQHQRDARRAGAALLPLEHQAFPRMQRGHRRLLAAAVAHQRPRRVVGRLAAEVLSENDAQGRDNLRVRRARLASDLGIGFLVQPQHQGQHGGPDHVRLLGTRHERSHGVEPGKPQKRSRPRLEIFAHPHSMQAREAVSPNRSPSEPSTSPRCDEWSGRLHGCNKSAASG